MTLVAGPRFLAAQDDSAPAAGAATSSDRSDTGSRWVSYGLGVGIGGAGFVLGALAGVGISGECDEAQCLGTAFWLGAAGASLGVGTGVHLGNGSRGNLWLDLLTSVGIGAAGAGIGAAFGGDTGTAITLVAASVASVVVTTEVERATGRSRARKRQALHAGPRGIELGLGATPIVRRGTLGMTVGGRLRL